MELHITNSDKCEQFIGIFQNIKSFSESINISLNNEGLYLQTMDGSNVSIFELRLSSDWFDSYKLTENITIGINSNIFQKVISLWNKNLIIKVDTPNKDYDKLNISLENRNIEKDFECSKYFEIPLIEIEHEILNIPDTEYTVDIDISGNKFKKIIDELSLMGDLIKFDCTEKNITAFTESHDGSMKLEIHIDEENESYCIEEGSEISCNFRLKYIKSISSIHKLSKLTSIHLSEDIPMLIKFEINENSSVRFFLAPQIND